MTAVTWRRSVRRHARRLAGGTAVAGFGVLERFSPRSLPRFVGLVARAAPFPTAHQRVRRALGFQVATGGATAAARSARRLAARDGRWIPLAHELALRAGDLDAAAELGERVPDPDHREHLLVERLLASYDGAAAAAVVETSGRVDRRAIMQRLRVHTAIGRFDHVLEILDAHGAVIEPLTARVTRAEALRWTGRAAEAAVLTEQLARDAILDPRVFRLVRDLDSMTGTSTRPRLDHLVDARPLDPVTVSRLLPMLWDLGEHDEVDALATAVGGWSPTAEVLTPPARLTLVRNDYVRRDFDRAIERIDALRGTTAQLGAEHLRARIILERGDHAGAVASRDANPDPPEWLDEVRYHGLLRLRRYTDAYELYLSRADRLALRAVFGARAEFGPQIERVGTRLVVSQMGPGDEVLLASTYAALAERSERLVATCEPRLTSLLQRSFPAIELLPTDRWMRPRPGVLAPDRPPRSGDVLYPVLTAEARNIGLACDRVLLSRSLHWLARRTAAPTPGYLRPDPVVVAAHAARRGDERTIGIVWRSELRSPMRTIHYLGVADLEGILAEHDTVVCLQYDVDDGERAQLLDRFGDRVRFLEGVDLRDDFDDAAALLASLDAVVGVGTTTVELSAAVGTPTVLLTSNHHGTWRAADDAGHDHWHPSMRVAAIAQPWDRPALARRARSLLEAMLDDPRPRSAPP